MFAEIAADKIFNAIISLSSLISVMRRIGSYEHLAWAEFALSQHVIGLNDVLVDLFMKAVCK